MASVLERLQAKKKKVVKVTTSDGDVFWIRSLSDRESDDAIAAAMDSEGNIPAGSLMRQRFLRSVLESESGGRAFSDKDADAVANLEEYAVVEIYAAINKLNARADLGKKPETSSENTEPN